MPADFVNVSYQVPADRALAFQSQAQRLLEQLTGGEPGPDSNSPDGRIFRPMDAAEARQLDVWKLPEWGSNGDDEQRAAWLLNDLHDNQRRIVASFVHHGTEDVDGDTVGEEAGYESGARGVAPALAAIALRCRRVYRRPMWHFRDSPSGDGAGTYRMDASTQELFIQVLDAEFPEWRNW